MWKIRALELNNQEMWNWQQATTIADYAHEQGFTTMVVGQAELLDKLVMPEGYTPRHFNDRLSSQQRARCIYLNRLAQYCQQLGLTFYLQAKEISFPVEILLCHPQLFDVRGNFHFDGAFWSQYLAAKLELVARQIPAMTGILLAISNTDSLLPISEPYGQAINAPHATTSPRGQEESLGLYRRLFSAAAEVMKQQDKHLVLRVFPASNSDVENVLSAIKPLPESVSVSIKLTPERFWPEFPNNPALLEVTERDVWVEIDLVGEEVGWGNFPFMRVEEIQGRLLWCQAKNPAISGALCKISWEGMDNHWILGCISEINLFSCTHFLMPDAHADNEIALLARWLQQRYQWAPATEVLEQLHNLLERAHQALYGAIYARRHVFHRHSLLPESYGQAMWSLYGQLNRNHWLPGSERDIQFIAEAKEMSANNLFLLAQEKDRSYQLAIELQREALTFSRRTDIPAKLKRRWEQEWQGFALYCRTFVHAQKAFFTLHYCKQVENTWSLREICQTNIQALYGTAYEMEDFCLQHRDFPVSIHVMFDAERARALASSLTEELSQLMQ